MPDDFAQVVALTRDIMSGLDNQGGTEQGSFTSFPPTSNVISNSGKLSWGAGIL